VLAFTVFTVLTVYLSVIYLMYDLIINKYIGLSMKNYKIVFNYV